MTVQRERVLHPLNVVFGDEIRARRHGAGLSQVKLGEILGCTGQWIGQVENGDKDPSREFALDLDTFFATGGTFIRMAKEIKKLSRQLIHLPGFPAYLEAESKAKFIRSFDTQLVPGLLQIEDYARSLISRRSGQSVEMIEALVSARMERHTIFQRRVPAQGIFVLDEAVLRRTVGGAEVMRAQLSQLETLACRPEITVQILPFSSVVPAGLDGSFILLGFADKTELAYIEGPALSHLIDAPDNLNECRVRFERVLGEALPQDDSLKMIRQAREAL